MKMKVFEYCPATSSDEGSDILLKESKEKFENEVNAFCAKVHVCHVVPVRDDVIAVWYEKGEKTELNKLLDKSVSSIEWSIRTRNIFETTKFKILRDLVSKTEKELSKYRNFGKRSLSEVKEKLHALGLSLGMNVDLP